MNALNQWFQGINLDRILEWLMFAAAALIAISVHESCHALSAYSLGDDTGKRMGRISLNPLHHLEPVGFVMMVVAHFGWARPVMVNPYRMTKVKNPKLGMALTAAAGPISNILLALIFCFAYALSYEFSPYSVRLAWYLHTQYGLNAGAPGAMHYVLQFFSACFSLNVGLAVFNLIPVPPLDGSKLFAILLPNEAYAKLMRYERYGMLALIALLFLGVLDRPLSFLVNGLATGISKLAFPAAEWLAGLF